MATQFHIRVFSDYICPFCYVGKGLIDTLKQEFEIEDEWVGLEIHPDTPPEGVTIAEKFQGMDLSGMEQNLRHMGAPYGLQFALNPLLSNSHLALLASEYARDHGQFAPFHERLFEANFRDGKDIGQMDVLLDVAEQTGLDPEDLRAALADGRYESCWQQAQETAMQYGISSTPTFIINGRYKVTGARPIEVFRRALRQIENAEV